MLENLLFVAVLAVLCIMLYSLHKEHAVEFFNYRFMRVLSDSMEPTLSPNDCIIVKQVPENQLEIGDIITFVSFENEIYGQYNTHRIVDIGIDAYTGKRYYVTKGDRFDTNDSSYTIYENISGKFVRKLPLGKYISFAVTKLSDSRIYFVVVIFPLLLCLITYINQLIRIFAYGSDGDDDT